jgi:uncharacterized protein YjbJ (UPF0337 family)
MNEIKDIGFEIAEAGAPMLSEALGKVRDVIQDLKDKWDSLTPDQQEAIVQFALLAASIGPVLMVLGSLVSTVGSLIIFGPMLVGALGAVLAAVGPVIAIFAGAVAAGLLLYKNWDTIKAKAGELKENVTQKFSELKTGVTNSIENTKQIALNKFEGLKSSAINKAEQIKSKVSSSFESLKSNATSAFENLKSDVSGKAEDVWSKVSGVADRLKGVFNFSWSLPRPKLPHITWSWNNIGGIVSVPSFGIDWYKKAYDEPIMFTRPTVLQTPSGLKGFGDGNGGEVVLSEAKLRQMSGDHNYTVNVYGAEGQSVDALAQAVQNKFVQWQKQEESVYA